MSLSVPVTFVSLGEVVEVVVNNDSALPNPGLAHDGPPGQGHDPCDRSSVAGERDLLARLDT